MPFSDLESTRINNFFNNLPSVKANSDRARLEEGRHMSAYERRTTPRQRMADEIRVKARIMEYNFWLRMDKLAGIPRHLEYL